MLLTRNYCVGGLARVLMLTEAAISQHLKVLKEAGIITGYRSGYFMHYQVNRSILKHMADGLHGLSEIPRTNSASCHPVAKENCLVCNFEALAYTDR